MKNSKGIIHFLLLFLMILAGCSLHEEKGSGNVESPPYLMVINGLSESLGCIDNHGDDLVESEIQTGQAPNQILKHTPARCI
jgi:hypothetical protein